MTRNCVTLDSTIQVLRYGTPDFSADDAFNAGTETYHANVGFRVAGLDLKYHKVVAGSLAEMTAGEKTTVDDAETTIVDNLPVNGQYSLLAPESLGTDELVIDPDIYHTTCTSAQNRTCAAGTHGMLKKISNSSGGSVVTTFSPRLRGAATQKLTLTDGNFAILIYDVRATATDRWIALDGVFTLS